MSHRHIKPKEWADRLLAPYRPLTDEWCKETVSNLRDDIAAVFQELKDSQEHAESQQDYAAKLYDGSVNLKERLDSLAHIVTYSAEELGRYPHLQPVKHSLQVAVQRATTETSPADSKEGL